MSTAHARVRRSFDRALAENTETAQVVIGFELDRLDAMLAGIWGAASTGNLRAIDRALNISKRRMAILGLEFHRVEHGGPDGGPIQVEQQAWEMIVAKVERYLTGP